MAVEQIREAYECCLILADLLSCASPGGRIVHTLTRHVTLKSFFNREQNTDGQMMESYVRLGEAQ
jgi:hypothetical protein